MLVNLFEVVPTTFVGLNPSANPFRSQPPSSLVKSFIVSRVDYCNSIQAGLPTCQLDRIQSVLNSAARLIYGRTPSDHITDLLRDNLHWLRVPQRIVYKSCLVTYKTLNDHRMPDYISDFCIRVADKRLRSSQETCYTYHGLPRLLVTVPFPLQDPLHGTASPTTSRTRHRWRSLNRNSKLIL